MTFEELKASIRELVARDDGDNDFYITFKGGAKENTILIWEREPMINDCGGVLGTYNTGR